MNPSPMARESRVYVAGHKGLVGSAIVRALESRGFTSIITRSRSELDLTRQDEVDQFFEAERPDHVFLAAAKVGGILANRDYPAEFIRDNLQIQTNVIDAAYRNGTRKLLFLGSSCIYPRDVAQPIRESSLLTGPLEATNAAYAVAKIAGVSMVQSYRRQYGFDAISAMPTNVYGPGDLFDLERAHVLPALLRRFHEAKAAGCEVITLWGSGSPQREFLHCDDLASACVFLMDRYSGEEIVNVGVGKDIAIHELADLIRQVTGFEGRIEWDTTKPEGTPRKLLDVSRLVGLGWSPQISLREGVEQTYDWFRQQIDSSGSVRLNAGY